MIAISTIMFIIAALAAGTGVSTKYIFKLEADNKIEEICEEVIKEAVDIDVDLSPETPEDFRK